MMFLLIICGLAILCLYVTSVECANVSLGQFTISSTECRSTEDIVFDFTNNDNDPKSRHTLATCLVSHKFCFLSPEYLNSSYVIWFTGFGAIFSVKNTFEIVQGKYLCCSAYSNNCVQLDISLCTNNTFKIDQGENNQEETDRNHECQISSLEMLLTIIPTVACVVLLAILVALLRRKWSSPLIDRKWRKRLMRSSNGDVKNTYEQVNECDEETTPLNEEVQNGVLRRDHSITCRNSRLDSRKDTMTQAILRLVIRTIHEHTFEHAIGMEAPINYGGILTVLKDVVKQTIEANRNTCDRVTQTALEKVLHITEEYIKKRDITTEDPVTCEVIQVILTLLEKEQDETNGANTTTRDGTALTALEIVIRNIEEGIKKRNIATDAYITFRVILTVLEYVDEETSGANKTTLDKLPDDRMDHYNEYHV
ncbi:uncharacterized protein LOC127873780 [Dreissena polymorpha]|uniref:Uncharacterized protein n=1 Tax=Dreissena polymorpha TaxID=45954 RepID=A0A9D4KYE8_DREPO|nr:uncharacterized protein LOC127873780 [Dreissena polymorpha]XP_052273720.1 uncharacterized protein LOC127873780 [Dreissena polymorpha]KAH3847989.1 hypothetical protein DPMN_090325 [Dreissena polymorpha]